MTVPVSVVMRRAAEVAARYRAEEQAALKRLRAKHPRPRPAVATAAVDRCGWCGAERCRDCADVEALWQVHLSADVERMDA